MWIIASFSSFVRRYFRINFQVALKRSAANRRCHSASVFGVVLPKERLLRFRMGLGRFERPSQALLPLRGSQSPKDRPSYPTAPGWRATGSRDKYVGSIAVGRLANG